MLYRFSSLLAQVNVSPTSSRVPGGTLVQQMLGWLGQPALWASLASILVGTAIYGLSQQTSHHGGAHRGKQLAVAGVIGACLAGIAPTAINMLFSAAGGR